MQRKFLLGVISLLCAIASYVGAMLSQLPWCDEIMMSAIPANLSRGLGWFVHIPSAFSPVFTFPLSAWYWLFGVSHSSSIAFGVFCSYFASLEILYFCYSRRLFETTSQGVLFLGLFWGGWMMSEILVLGRLDIIAIVLLMPLVNELTKPNESMSGLRVYCYSLFVGTLTVYTFPIVAMVCLFMLWVKDREGWRFQFKIDFLVVAGLMSGLMSVWALAVSRGSLLHWFRLTLASSETVHTACAGHGIAADLFFRILEAYRVDGETLVLAGIVGCLFVLQYKYCHSRYRLASFALVASVPLFMGVAGRYRNYYCWLQYLPAIVMLVHLLGRYNIRSKVMAVLFGLSLLPFCFRVYAKLISEDYIKSQDLREDAELFVNKHSKLLQSEFPVVLLSFHNESFDEKFLWSFYYPLENIHAEIWQSSVPYMRSGIKAKVQKHVERYISSASGRRIAYMILNHVQITRPTLPSTGFLILRPTEEFTAVKKLFEEFGHVTFRNVVCDEKYCVYRFEYEQ